MKIQKPFTAKRILSIVLSIVVFGFMAFILLGPSSSVMDTAQQMCFMTAFMFSLSVALMSYGLFGGKEPEIGLIPKTPKDEKTDKA